MIRSQANTEHRSGEQTPSRLAGLSAGSEFPSIDALPEFREMPDPLVMLDGSPVRTPQDWYEKRRPELKALFQHYVYGYMPPPPKISACVTKTEPGLLDGRCTLKEVEIKLEGLPDNAPRLHVALFMPTLARGPSPVFAALNRCGNQAIIDAPAISINPTSWLHPHCKGPLEETRGSEHNFWCLDLLIDRGYSLAALHESDIVPDKPDDAGYGIRRFYPNLKGPKESRWGTLAAWAWGLERVVDYLLTDPNIDSRNIALIGHSRRGKAALLAAAFDERVALVVPHQSGTGGLALSRNNSQETVEHINQKFPHWFNGNFRRFAGQEEKLPVDQHLLAALVAPRALLDTEGLKDQWANYDSGLSGLQLADRVWKFLGAKGIARDPAVGPETNLNSGAVGEVIQYRLDAAHNLDRNYWQAILDFADKLFNCNQ